MHEHQEPYYQLHEALLDYEGTSLYLDRLVEWLKANPQEKVWLAEVRNRVGTPIPSIIIEESWRLYALSRVLDLLLLGLPSHSSKETTLVNLTLSEFEQFATALGLSIKRPTEYTPFYHEVVSVKNVESATKVSIIGNHWPCLMLGNMMVLRSGVSVEAPKEIIDKDVVNASILYWTYRRNHQRTEDMSYGWGGNSQWRTEFRRDYLINGVGYYNVDGVQINELKDSEVPISERIEVLVNRCFVVTKKVEADHWVYDDF